MGDLSGFFARPRPLEAAVFVALIEQAEAVPFLMDCLDPVRPFPAEKEQGIAVRVKLKAVLDDIHQTVQLFSHICVPGAQIDLFHPGEIT